MCFYRKYSAELESNGVSSAWIVTSGSLRKFLSDSDRTFCITNKHESQVGDAEEQHHRKIVCDTYEDEVKFRIAFQVCAHGTFYSVNHVSNILLALYDANCL
jgi:hypothetical protein